jgi:hypothetical protein
MKIARCFHSWSREGNQGKEKKNVDTVSDKSEPSSGVYNGLTQSTWLIESEGGRPKDRD